MTENERPAGTGWATIVGVALGLSLLVGVLVSAFAWPAANTEPRDVPLAVAPAAAVGEVQQRLDAAAPGAFDLVATDDAEAAREAIEDREVYGAIVLDPAGPPQVLTASAAGPVVAQVLTEIAAQLAAAESGGAAATAPVEDVVPMPVDDPRGAAFAAGALPMVMGGLVVGIAMSSLVRGIGRQVAGALLAAAGAGTAAVAVLQSWLDSIGGSFVADAGAIALTVAAISVTIIGLRSLIGPAGIGVAALVIFVLGNPLSGLASAPEMLPDGWGALGQALPPGAGGSLLRSTAFFDNAGAGGPALVLACWLAAGLLLAGIGAAVASRRAVPVSAETTNPAVPAVP